MATRYVPARVRGCHSRPLGAGWRVWATAPGLWSSPVDLEKGTGAIVEGLSADGPCTVAAALSVANRLSPDGEPQLRLDAFDWWYQTTFAWPDIGADDGLALHFGGLATICDAWLDGEPLFSSDNMFLRRRVDIANITSIKRRQSSLVLRFSSLDALLAKRRPRPRWRAPMVAHQQLRWYRTTLLGRTPGWSPPTPPVGPWRPISLEHAAGAAYEIDELATDLAPDLTAGRIRLRGRVIGRELPRRMLASRGGETWATAVCMEADGRFSAELGIENVHLWWPHTHGEPARYEVAIEPEATQATRGEVALGSVGFRSLDLDTGTGTGKPNEEGRFALAINGVPVFAAGACWTPLDATTFHAPRSEYEKTIIQVRDAGMNMLRVGGTMVYESEDFLDLLDSHGILLWQDFMFANMDYPAEDAAFAANVALEATQTLGDLRSHPCLAVLCGNSEVSQQAAMWGTSKENWSPELFRVTLAQLSTDLCPGVPYWPSSAYGGAFPHAADSGTASYYGVGAYLRPLDDARRAKVRFASECLAFANVPAGETLEQISGGGALRVHHPAWKLGVPRDLGAGWDFDDVRDHYLERLFGGSALSLRYADHDRYLALSRVVTGEVMASTLGEWRRKASVTTGGLIWFLRDLRKGAGWGIIDATGRPKAAYAYVRRALAPVALYLSDEGGNGLAIHIACDRSDLRALVLDLRLFRSFETETAKATVTVALAGRNRVELAAGTLLDGFIDITNAYRFGPPVCDLVVASVRQPDQSAPLAEAFFFPLGLHSIAPGQELGMTAFFAEKSDQEAELHLTTRRFAQSVAIDVPGFLPSDDYFHMAPASERRIRLRPLAAPSSPTGVVRPLNASAAIRIGVAQ